MRPSVAVRQPADASAQMLLQLLSEVEPQHARHPVDEKEWQRLIEDAARREVEAFLYHRLRELLVLPDIPAAVRSRLEELYCLNGIRNQLLYAEVARVLSLLRDEGIDVIVLKGAYLAQHVYPDFALRTMSDVDLLVHAEEIEHVASLLGRLGYGCTQPYGARHLDKAYHLPPFTRPGAFPLEIHWALERPSRLPGFDVDGLWARAMPVAVADVPVRRLSATDLVFHLCLHEAYHHRWGVERWGVEGFAAAPLRPLLDLALSLRHHAAELDPPLLARLANDAGLGGAVYSALVVVRRLMGARLPAELLRSLNTEPNDNAAVEDVMRLILTSSSVHSVQLLAHLQKVAQSPGWRERLVAIRFLALPPRSTMAEAHGVPLNSPRLALHYLSRLTLTFVVWAGRVLRLLSSEDGRTALALAARRCRIAFWTARQARSALSSPRRKPRPF